MDDQAAAQAGHRIGTIEVYDIDNAGYGASMSGPMRRLVVVALAYAVGATAIAAPLAPAVRTEIDMLLTRLDASSCAFNRNGSWHTAAEATAHLNSKLQYLEKHATVKSAEQFIELAASRSSISGEPYLVRCGNDAPVQSGTWLLLQLRAIRSPVPAGR